MKVDLPGKVDASRAGETIYISNDIQNQTIKYSVRDVLGCEVYYSEEAEKYIKHTRNSRATQKYILNYLQKIPTILRDPSVVIVDSEDFTERTLVYYKEVFIKEFQKHKLFALVVKIGEHRIVYNLHPQESGKVKLRREKAEVIYIKTGYKKSKYY